MKTGIKIIRAEYVRDYVIKLTFSDGRVNEVDFKNQVMSQKVPEYKIYQNTDEFKKFRIEEGNIVWGEDWDLVFHLHKLYDNTLDIIPGRKKNPDKKVLLPIYVNQSIINAHGGIDRAKEKVYQFLKMQ
jgi:hypothetical protein